MLKSKLLSNKYVLYFLLLLSITHVLGYIETNNFDALALFMTAGFVSTYFTKNMIIVLAISLILGGCKLCVSAFSDSLKEGFREGNGNKQAATATNQGSILFTVLGQSSPKDCKQVSKKETECKKHCDKSKGCDPAKAKVCYGCKDWNTHCDKDKPRFCKNKRSGFTNMNQPPNFKSYFNSSMGALDRILGKGDFQGLANAHSDLIDNQKNLLESLVSMKPIIEDSKEKLEMAKDINTKKMMKLMSRMNDGKLSGLMRGN